ncbi:hypothetical protein NDU88_005780 [Pleurodeles waltl]|uniref:Uncharacterized protein n=1 Tax=Pleurodeles waltl TaxID=8319 RepID=A0AAV7NNH8_PLEWA|nr:hypothetical protein NDU88_005780 [Pleurodeles waltl]
MVCAGCGGPGCHGGSAGVNALKTQDKNRSRREAPAGLPATAVQSGGERGLLAQSRQEEDGNSGAGPWVELNGKQRRLVRWAACPDRLVRWGRHSIFEKSTLP